jgi:hypothetical protein
VSYIYNKFNRRMLGSLLFSLVLVVALREAPETVSLADQVYNDGTVVSCVHETGPQIHSRVVTPVEGRSLASARLFTFTTPQGLSSTDLHFPVAGPDLLHLLSLQRV